MSCRTEKPKPKAKALAGKPEGKLLNKTQRKLAGHLLDAIPISMACLEESVVAAQGGAFDQELPPSLLPKCRLAVVSMKEMSATLDLLLSEGWRGDANQSLQDEQTKMELCKEVKKRLETVIEEANKAE